MFHWSVEFNETSFSVSVLFQERGCLCCLCTSASVGAAPKQWSFSCLTFIWWPEPNARGREASDQHKVKQPWEPFVRTSLARTKHQNTDEPVTIFFSFRCLHCYQKTLLMPRFFFLTNIFWFRYRYIRLFGATNYFWPKSCYFFL